MQENQEKINELLKKLDLLLHKQHAFNKELKDVKEELVQLQNKSTATIEAATNASSTTTQSTKEISKVEKSTPELQETTTSSTNAQTKSKNKWELPTFDLNIERFIGENLISTIGILITIIGVAIGARYSIEHNLISPLTRIILGYLAGIALLGTGLKLKAKYTNYSAILVSGAMAILYFITYLAYSFYGLIPQSVAFGLMVLFTIFTVLAALTYDRQVIAHIGLVGAYGVPFLLGDDSGNVITLFTYMSIINIGILLIAFRKNWKILQYVAFVLTWLIYFQWYESAYRQTENFTTAIIFASIFFAIFYAISLGFQIFQKTKLERFDLGLILTNAFIFYALGYGLLNHHETGQELLGLYTIGNAVIHFVVSAFLFQRKLADRNLFYLVSGLVLVFITIAIPVQLDGNWVTLLWAAEAALLFWIGRTKGLAVYEKLSYPLMFLAFFSLLHDFSFSYNRYYPEGNHPRIRPLLNIHFLSSLLFIAAFAFINYINTRPQYMAPVQAKKGFLSKFRFIASAIPAILLFALYTAFWVEIDTYWTQLYRDSKLTLSTENYPKYQRDSSLLNFKNVWVLIYSMFFLATLTFVNSKKIKSKGLSIVNLGLSLLCLFVFLSNGLQELEMLKDIYYNQTLAEFYPRTPFYIGIRYIAFAFAGLLLLANYEYLQAHFVEEFYEIPFDVVLHFTVLLTASYELMHWLGIANANQSDKLGLSIFWGVYALFLIAFGLWKKKKHLRIGGMGLFAITLVKLFLYDLAHLDTIAKTIVLVSLGVLLLIVSFLYNKYKERV